MQFIQNQKQTIKKYCKSNGQFARHLKKHNLTNRDYYEIYITKYTPLCTCLRPVTYYRDGKYANSCGDPRCVGNTIKIVKSSWSDEKRIEDSKNKKAAAKLKTVEQKQIQVKKAKNTFQTRYGVEWGSKSELQKEKSKQTKLEKYGDPAYNNSKASAAKNRNKSVEEQNRINRLRRETTFTRFGVEHAFLLPGVKERSAASNSKGKEFTLPSGKIVRLRGYEPIAINELLNRYVESDLIFHDTYCTKYNLPVFQYVNVNQHTQNYYPDIYIPKENKIIEVKSQWWWDGNGAEKYASRLKNNLKKRAAVLEKGFTYEVWLFDDKKTYKVLSTDADFNHQVVEK